MIRIEHLDYILTMDPSRRILTDASVVIDGERIAAIGKTDEVLRDYPEADQVIDGRGRLMMPGHINAHLHTTEHLSRSLIPDDIRTAPWCLDYSMPFHACFTPEDQYVGTLTACVDMIKCGTTTFCESGIPCLDGNLEQAVRAMEDSGIRAIFGSYVSDRLPDVSGRWKKEWARAFCPEDPRRWLEEPFLRYQGKNDRLRPWAHVTGIQWCSDKLFRMAKEIADQHKAGMGFHLTSTLEEAEATEKETGSFPISHHAGLGSLGPNSLIYHVIAVRDEEVRILKDLDVKVVHCPGTALRLGKGATVIGKFPEMIDAGVTVALGSDGTSACGTSDMLRQAFLVAGLFKDARMDPTVFSAELALDMLLLNGARALLWDDEIGSLAVGKRADLLLYDIQRLEWQPMTHPVRNIVYSADSGSLRTVMIDGRTVLDEGRLTTVNEEEVLTRARETFRNVMERSEIRVDSAWPIQ